MKQLNRWKLLVTLPLLIGAVLFGAATWDDAPAADNGVIPLRPPAFVGVAQAQGDPTQQIRDEAGIAAYFNAGQTINLNDVKSLFRSDPEDETADYIIGSIPVPDYVDENHDVHVYAHTNGWVLAYYHNDEVTAKIFDWRYYDGPVGGIKTRLERVLEYVAFELQISSPPIQHYHFVYPNANKLMLITEQQVGNGIGTFQFNLPDNLTYYEGSWSLSENDTSSYNASFRYDDDVLFESTVAGWSFHQNSLNSNQMMTDTLHTVKVSTHIGFAAADDESGFAGIAIVYQGP